MKKNILSISKDLPPPENNKKKIFFLLQEERKRRKIFDESQKTPPPPPENNNKKIFSFSSRKRRRRRKKENIYFSSSGGKKKKWILYTYQSYSFSSFLLKKKKKYFHLIILWRWGAFCYRRRINKYFSDKERGKKYSQIFFYSHIKNSGLLDLYASFRDPPPFWVFLTPSLMPPGNDSWLFFAWTEADFFAEEESEVTYFADNWIMYNILHIKGETKKTN